MSVEKRATIVSSATAATLVAIKMIIGVMSGSVAVLASAIDSLLDLVISAFNYFALHNAQKEADDSFHFGRSKMEPLAAVIEGTIISLSALFILYEAISKLIYPRDMEFVTASIAVMIISIIITTLLVFYLNRVAKKTDNMVIKADALHYKTDIVSNAIILLSLILVSATGYEVIDALLGFAIAIYMIYSAYPLVKEGVLMLLDAALDPAEIKTITDILDANPQTANYHHLQTRESASHIFVSVHIVFNVSTSLYDAHLVCDKAELAIKKAFAGKKVHILIHMDPYDDSQINDLEDLY